MFGAVLGKRGRFEMFGDVRLILLLLDEGGLRHEVIDLVLFVFDLRGEHDLLQENLPFLICCLAHYLNRILYQPKYAPLSRRNYQNIRLSAQSRLRALGIAEYPLLAVWLPIMMDHLF